MNKSKTRERVRFGEWYSMFSPGGYKGVVKPLKRVEDNPGGQKVYRCKDSTHSCSGGPKPECKYCDRDKYTCYWVGYLGKRVPIAKAILVYGVEDGD